jgi:hypothetical protein
MNPDEKQTGFDYWSKKHDEEFLKHEKIEHKRHPCTDINAAILLNELVPLKPGRKMLSGTAHDEIFFYVNIEDLDEVLTEEQAIELIRCGVFYDPDCESLAMFV